MLIEVRGVIYQNVKHTSEALGITKEAVYSAMSRGTMDRLGLGVSRGKPVDLFGVKFKSMSAACRDLGFKRGYIQKVIATNSIVGMERIRVAVYVYQQKQANLHS